MLTLLYSWMVAVATRRCFECRDPSLRILFASPLLSGSGAGAAVALGPPGWGGAYKGSKVRCVASHDQRRFAQPDACTHYAPWLGGTSFAGWDEFPITHPSDTRSMR